MPSIVTDYGRPSSDAEASQLSRERLERTLAELAEFEVPVDGGLGSPHPLEAISTVVAEHEFDEIIIATLPRRLSRWLKADLPHQAERRFGLPVTTIITKVGPLAWLGAQCRRDRRDCAVVASSSTGSGRRESNPHSQFVRPCRGGSRCG
jgi:hypothetical protein